MSASLAGGPALYPTWYRVNGDWEVNEEDVREITRIILGR